MTAADAYKLHGITRRQVHSMCINLFHYPEQYKDTLESYFILRWNSQTFTERMNDGIIPVRDTEYLVVYQDCTPFAVKRAAEIKLSFRKAKKEYGIPGYVIVKIVTSTTEENT
jgi:hypothetical protein